MLIEAVTKVFIIVEDDNTMRQPVKHCTKAIKALDEAGGCPDNNIQRREQHVEFVVEI